MFRKPWLFFFALSILASPAGASDLVCMDLFMRPLEIDLPGPPPETVAWQRNQQRRRELEALGVASVPFRIGTWNTNLLSFPIQWGLFNLGRLSTPNYVERAERMPGWIANYLRGDQAPDTLLLQEVWTAEDDQRIAQAAQDAGYMTMFPNTEGNSSSGLQILIRESVLNTIDQTNIHLLGEKAAAQKMFERFGHVERGLMYVKITLQSGIRLMIGNVHLTPFAGNFQARAQQVSALKKAILEQSGDVDYVLVGGDFNIAADFSTDSPDLARQLARGRALYDQFGEDTGAIDTFRAVAPMGQNGFTLNPEFPSFWRFGDRPSNLRLDYVWARENFSNFRVLVEQAQTLFGNRVNALGDDDPDGLFRSDHLAYVTDLRFFVVP